MSIEPHLGFYNSQTLGQKGSIESIVHILKKEKYELFNFYVGSLLKPDAQWGTNFRSGGLEKAYEKNNVSFMARNKEMELEFQVHLTWNITLGDGKKHAYVGVATNQTARFYPNNERAVEYSNLLLYFGKILYSKVLPDFGWIDLQEPSGSTWFDVVEQCVIDQVYWANFYGPRYIAKYGIKNLLSTPAWQTETLNNQGCLVVLSAVLGQHEKIEVIKEYLEKLLQKRNT